MTNNDYLNFTLLRSSKNVTITYLIISNFINKVKPRKSVSFRGSSFKGVSLTESINYINRVFNNYLYYGSLAYEGIAGKTILEIGPGANVGVALKFVASGAEKVICVDKLQVKEDSVYLSALYQALINQMSYAERKNISGAIDTRGERAILNRNKIEAIYGTAIENELFKKEQFDIILSRVVLEYIYDVDRAFNNMDFWLRPGGILLHKIDLRYPEIFPHANPLTFLTISERLWKYMTSYSGRPNRKRVTYYKQKLESLSHYDYKFYIARVIGSDIEIIPHKLELNYGIDYDERNLKLIREIRPKLSNNFRNLSDEDLLISDIHGGTEANYLKMCVRYESAISNLRG